MPWPALIPLGHHLGKPAIPIMRPVLLVGSRHNAHLHLLSRQISKAHAFIISSDGKVYIRDLASRTHVYVNGQEVREADLVDGDMLKLGSFTFRFQAAAGMKQKPAPDTTPAGQLDVQGGQFPLQIDERVMLVGRRPACDVSLMEESCSTAHAVFFSMGGKRFVRDLGSRTGTFVNGTSVRQQEINFGDTVRIGDSDIRYEPSNLGAFGGDNADELEDLVGTAPLVSDDVEIPEPAAKAEAPIPLAVDDEPAATEPQMLVGDNLMGDEKLSASATGAGMQDAAREAMELAGEKAPEPKPAFDLGAPIEVEALDFELPPEAAATSSHAPSEDPIPVDFEPLDLSPVESHVSETPLELDFSPEAEAQGMSEDELLADLSAPPKPPVAEEPELLSEDELLKDFAAPSEPVAEAPKPVATDAFDLLAMEEAPAEPEPVAEALPLDEWALEAEEPPPVEAVESAPPVEPSLDELEPPEPLPHVAPEAAASEVELPPIAVEPPTAVSETPAFAHQAPAVTFDAGSLASEVESAVSEPAPADARVEETVAVEPVVVAEEVLPAPAVVEEVATPHVDAPMAFDAGLLASEAGTAPTDTADAEIFFGDESLEEITQDATTVSETDEITSVLETHAVVESPAAEVTELHPTEIAPIETPVAIEPVAEARDVSPIHPATVEESDEFEVVPLEPVTAEAIESVPIELPAIEEAHEFELAPSEPLVGEALPAIEAIHPEEAKVEESRELELPSVAESVTNDTAATEEPGEFALPPEALHAAELPVVAEVIEATEPTAESALALDEIEPVATPHDESAFAVVEPGLSDTTFGRQMAQFASDSAEPIVEADATPAEESAPVAIAEPLAAVSETPADIDLEAPAPGDLDFGFAAVDEMSVIADPDLELATTEVTLPAGFTETPDVVADLAHSFTEVAAETSPVAEAPVVVEPQPLLEAPEFNLDAQEEPPAFAEALELEQSPEAPVLDQPVAFEDLPLEEFPEAVEEAPVEEFQPVEDALTLPAAEVPAYAPRPVIPGMPLDFSEPVAMPDFVGGMPLVLNELPPPPPTFGRVQVSFNGSFGPQAVVDEALTNFDEPGPFDNLQIDVDNPVPDAPVAVAEAAPVEEEPYAEELAFEELPTAEPEAIGGESLGELPTVQDEPLELSEEALFEELEAPATEPVAEAASEFAQETPLEEPPALQPGPFANGMRVPPAPRRPREAADESSGSAGLSTPKGFEGLTSAPGLGNVDVFSQGFSADLSNDPVFGGAVKPTPAPEPERKGRRKIGAPAEPEFKPSKKRRTLITPSTEPVEDLADKLADDLGAPALSELPTMPEAQTPRSLRRAAIEQAAPAPQAYLNAAAPRRGNGKRVAVLLAVMVIMMATAAWLIFSFLQKQVRFTGMLTYENFGKLTSAQQTKLKLEQQSILVGERARDVALAEFKHEHPTAAPGFLGNLEDFGRNEFRVTWDKGTLTYGYVGSDPVLDGDRVRAVLEGLSKLNADVRLDAERAQQAIRNARANLDQKERELADMAARHKAAQERMNAQPADDRLREFRAEAETAEKAFGDASLVAQQAGEELKRLESQQLTTAAAQAPNAPGAPPVPAAEDPQLEELEKSLDAMKARMATARNTVSEQADLARKSLDAAIEELQRSTTTAEGMLKDNPELSAFVAEAQKTQQTVQKLSADLLDRQQKSYEKLLETKTLLDEHLAQRRKELWDSDKQIKRLKDDLAMRERGYNAAREQGYEKEAADIHKELEAGLAAVEKRKADLEADPMLQMLNDLMARGDQDIAIATRQLDADRAQADSLAAEIKKSFEKLAPAVEKLPESQRTLAQQMSGKMEAVNNARKVVADAIEAKNPSNGGLKMLDDQVKQLSAQVEERKKTVEALNNQQLPEDEMKKRQAAAEQKRAAYAAAVKTKADLEAVWFDKLKQVQRAEAQVDAAGSSRAEDEKLTTDFFNLRDKELPQLRQSLAQQEQNALTMAYPSEPRMSEPVLLEDRRMPFTAFAIAGLAILFSLAIFFTSHSHKPAYDPYAYPPATAAEHPVEAFGGLGLVDMHHVEEEKEESKTSAAA